jgi:hypothetical protein
MIGYRALSLRSEKAIAESRAQLVKYVTSVEQAVELANRLRANWDAVHKRELGVRRALRLGGHSKRR